MSSDNVSEIILK